MRMPEEIIWKKIRKAHFVEARAMQKGSKYQEKTWRTSAKKLARNWKKCLKKLTEVQVQQDRSATETKK